MAQRRHHGSQIWREGVTQVQRVGAKPSPYGPPLTTNTMGILAPGILAAVTTLNRNVPSVGIGLTAGLFGAE
jgi:hypothetical protein